MTSAGKLVENSAVKSAHLLKPKPLFHRPSVFPFTVLYPFFFQIYFKNYDEYIKGSEWTFVYLGSIISLNVLLLLMPNWNTNIDALFNYNKVDSLNDATDILIHTNPNNGSSAIASISRDKYPDEIQTSFTFQKRRFIYHESDKLFTPPKFTIDEEPKLSVLQNSKGISGDISKLQRLYGKNFFDIPVPTFLELFKEHATAPFFVFQVFCVALWLLDEFWYYSLFTLFMLVSFEFTTVFQRRSTMSEFRTMGVKPFLIWVYRDGEWDEIETTDLLPGDLVSINRTGDDSAIPCDLILVDGSAIVNEAMLSGESTPLLKESIKLRPGHENLQLDGVDKNSILHGGTKALQVTAPSDTSVVQSAPDNGAFAIVAKTGFETSQGSLVRVMIFSAERISVGNIESFLFILFLLVFAIAASWYVWVEGTRMGRIQNKLILDCILIITSVVPPELPMELTMAVNTSLAALGKFYIYCTEPFRIPLAGRVDVCCFDKTGTLTGEDLVFEGLAGFGDHTRHLSKPEDAPVITNQVLASAHALVKLDDGEVVGDPMEKATLDAIGYKVGDKDVIYKEVNGKTQKIKILRRFQFSSALKRSSSISSVEGKTLVSVKGAPETIRHRLSHVPSDYEDIYKSFTRSGSRVLAIAYKYLENNISSSKLTKIERETVEEGLEFAGFIVFHCPLKDDAIETIEMLNESSHRCVMITGDNPLTAVHVAKEVKIVEREVLILDAPEEHHGNHELIWRNVEETKIIPFSSSDKIDSSFFATNDIALTGYALAKLLDHPQLHDLIKNTWVYARVSPAQKEFILNTLKHLGYNTLMCGDGTNDVGALKQAHVGVALLNGTEEGLKKIQESRKIEAQQKVYEKQVELFGRWQRPPPPVPLPIAHLYPPGPSNPNYLKAVEKQGIEITEEMRELAAKSTEKPISSNNTTSQNQAQSELADKLLTSLNQLEEENEAPTLKLGDASVAAPFTSKLANVSTVTNIVRQGRAALVSTIQMYKILALNCLISAYSLSVIYLAGVKFGDAQATISGVLISVCFLSISKGQPIQKLSKERPQPGIFNVYIMGSILGQFAIHIATLVYITAEIYKLEPREPKVDLEKEFAPSLLNTGIFLIQLAQQVSTFAVNYQGRPFKQGITENKGMYYGLISVAALALAGSTEFVPELNELMKFVPMSDEFKFKLTSTLVFDFVGSWAVELVFKFFFRDSKAADIAARD
ncbi:hypothetical protein WICMUC_004510 [Wickerhamomyces mucosus]|uniref:Uncharacterized protein n=1 Tax=Wickerhamomyces mucosus TaxID=1378264 RepID=A0A9P8TA33_9ASCO|nr:hypothetical protein WICMUC_004510 [Wickerhamomyces mucosus]